MSANCIDRERYSGFRDRHLADIGRCSRPNGVCWLFAVAAIAVRIDRTTDTKPANGSQRGQVSQGGVCQKMAQLTQSLAN
jgi:hypothetical protein